MAVCQSFLLTLSSGLSLLHCLLGVELKNSVFIFQWKTSKRESFVALSCCLWVINDAAKTDGNDQRKHGQIYKVKRKTHFGKCPTILMRSPNQAHFYLASLSEDQKALWHYCDRTPLAFILPSSTSPMIAMPYVFPAAELLLANKFYLWRLINT